MDDNETSNTEACSPPEGDLKKEVEKLVNVVFPPESRQHVLRATSELILAVDGAIPKGLVPKEVKDQCEVVRKETVTLVKTMVHAASCPQKAEEATEEKEEKGLQKIEFS